MLGIKVCVPYLDEFLNFKIFVGGHLTLIFFFLTLGAFLGPKDDSRWHIDLHICTYCTFVHIDVQIQCLLPYREIHLKTFLCF